MKTLVRWFARNPVAANLLMVLILAAGGLSVATMKREVFPETSTDLVTVSVPLPGATPEEVEEAVNVRVEEAVQGIEGVKRVTSTATEGVGAVTVELMIDADVRDVLDEVKNRVDAIDTFPEDAEQPIIQEVVIRRQVLSVAVAGKVGERVLRSIAERVRDELSALPGITQVELASARPYEISIEVSERALRRHGLTFADVAAAVRRSSVDVPGGAIRAPGGEVLLRTEGQAKRGPELERIPVLARPDGSRITLGDVATVRDAFADIDRSASFDGEPAVLVQVFRVGDQSALAISESVREWVEESSQRMAPGVSLTVWQDDARILRSRLSLLLRNGAQGLALVFLVLALFLRFRLAFWTAVGLPVSFLGALWVMPLVDVSINLISLFAFIVVLGIVVDDAIVTGENVHAHQERGKRGLQAAIDGAEEVAIPVTFAVLTTVVAFIPMLTVPGQTGKIMRVIPAVVIATLLFSLVESKLILPAHLSHLRPQSDDPTAGGGIRGGWRRFQAAFSRALAWFVRRVYTPSLERGLRLRYVTIAIGVATLVITVGLVVGGLLRFEFFPDVEADNAVAMLEMPLGTPSAETARAVARIEAAAVALRREIDAESGSETEGEGSVFRHVLATVGEQPFRQAQSQSAGSAGSRYAGENLGEVNIELAPSEERDLSSAEVVRRWREMVGAVPGASELTFTAAIFSAGEPVDVELAGRDLRSLEAAATELKEALRELPGVSEITDSHDAGKEELSFTIRPEAEGLGLTQADLGRQLRAAFFGEEAQRVQRGRDDVKVMVRLPEADRRRLSSLDDFRVRLPDGTGIPLERVADVERGRSPATIRRADRRRTLSVTADVDPSVTSAGDVNAHLRDVVLPRITQRHPSVTWSFEGERREQRETLGGLARGFALALLGIYALLAIPFRSYSQPLIVMSAIPFGLVGAVWGHLIMGISLTVLSMFGIVALAGVVVNDSLVLVDFVNRNREKGMELEDAVRRAGVARFRPILLTSLTTFAGLTPLLLERSVQAKFLIPMAVSLGFGVIFATFISLMLVPCGYLVLEDVRAAILGEAKRPEGRAQPMPKTAETRGS